MEKVRLFTLIVVVLLSFTVFRVSGQVQDTVIAPTLNDTLLTIEKVIKKPHSPHRATIYAMVLPGWGQIYNGQWWKLPILYGGVGASIYGLSWNTKQFNKYKDAYVDYSKYLEEKVADPSLPYPNDPSWDKIYVGGDVEGFTPQQQSNFKNQLKNKRTSFKRNRDLLYIVMGGIYILNIIDATVFAHFYDFEIDEDLSMSLVPTSSYSPVSGGTVGVTLTFNF